MVPSLGWQDAESGPPRKVQGEGCHQRGLAGRGSRRGVAVGGASQDLTELGLRLPSPHLQEQEPYSYNENQASTASLIPRLATL